MSGLRKSEELVTPLGRLHQLELRPYKIMTNYITFMIQIPASPPDNVTDAVLKETESKKSFSGEIAYSL